MLALSRCKNESFRIDDDVEIMIVKVQDNKVRLVSTPREISRSSREEIYLKMQEENEWETFTQNESK